MQRLEVSGAVRPLYLSLGFKGLTSENLQQDTRLHISGYDNLPTDHAESFKFGSWK